MLWVGPKDPGMEGRVDQAGGPSHVLKSTWDAEEKTYASEASDPFPPAGV